MKNQKKYLAAILVTLFFNCSAIAGGVSLGSTRVIYNSEDKIKQIVASNSDDKSDFLMQSWIEDGYGKLSNDIAVIPPLVLIKANSENTIRIMFNKKGLPSDKESVYWLNVKTIPEKSSDDNTNTLQFSVTNRIKVFYRPKELAGKSTNAYKNIRFVVKENNVVAINPTPFYVTLTNIKINNKNIDGLMLPPNNELIVMKNKAQGTVVANSINDYGGLDQYTGIIELK